MPAKWHNLIASMVVGGMTFQDAGQVRNAEGIPLYSKGYITTKAYVAIKQDERFCKALADKRAEIQAETGYTVKEWLRDQRKVLADSQTADDRVSANTALRSLAQHLGAFERDNVQRTNDVVIEQHYHTDKQVVSTQEPVEVPTSDDEA